ASVGAVTCFHVVEHLPFADVIHLLSEMMRVLRPAGLAIIETPNPENLRVGACDFYLDPTHRNPVPPAMLEYVVRSRGFADVEVIRLHPLASLVEEEEGALRLVREVDALLQGRRPMTACITSSQPKELLRNVLRWCARLPPVFPTSSTTLTWSCAATRRRSFTSVRTCSTTICCLDSTTSRAFTTATTSRRTSL